MSPFIYSQNVGYYSRIFSIIYYFSKFKVQSLIIKLWISRILNLIFKVWISGRDINLDKFKHYLNGVELADSVSLNPHKWFLTNMDCGCLWVKHPSFLVDSLSTKSDIMRNRSPASSTSTNVAPVIDYKDWQIALSRRFKVLKLWTVIRKHGYSGLMYHIRSDLRQWSPKTRGLRQ